jgi:hypothetical protein
MPYPIEGFVLVAIYNKLRRVFAQLPHNCSPLVLQQLEPALHLFDQLLAATKQNLLVYNTHRNLFIANKQQP